MHRVIRSVVVVAILVAWTMPARSSATILISKGSIWKYLDNGSNQGTAWRARVFNDSGWQSGPAELGYGDGDEDTLVGYGPDINNKFITTYFRHAFSVADPTLYQSLSLNLLRDDGAVVYLNDTEVFRSNMPAGSIVSSTPASSAISGTAESTFVPASINPALLVAGTNLLAVEIHQNNGSSTDISFDAELIASTSVQLTRGPYLQLGTNTSIVVRWRTNAATNSQVDFGLSPSTLTSSVVDTTSTTNHEVTLVGLAPATKYYYSVGTTIGPLAGGDTSHFFITSPPPGTAAPTRIWVLGDSGTSDANAQAVRNAYYAYTGTTPTNLMLMLGDNAYQSGTDAEYQTAIFDMYPTQLRQTVLWPTLGNHDGISANSATGTGPYYDMLTLPKQGEAGGVASGTEAYYSFDYGDIHFVCLESSESSRASNGPMLTWLQNDLAATNQRWVVAYWHHPPYSKGSHSSDVDIELIEMRQNAVPILEAYGVDLVLGGHSHSYERSFLIDGHYGFSSTFLPAMKKDGGSGQPGPGSTAYVKPTPGIAPHEGAVYAVAGSSGKTQSAPLNHPAMFFSIEVLGSMVLDFVCGELQARFVDAAGVVRDWFTLQKGFSPPVRAAECGLDSITPSASPRPRNTPARQSPGRKQSPASGGP